MFDILYDITTCVYPKAGCGNGFLIDRSGLDVAFDVIVRRSQYQPHEVASLRASPHVGVHVKIHVGCL